ncbi:cation-dependent mannose-6-phosphate receptor-like [Penaeus japonicus]|uniref:cation-dependent mannose-6-phosphate receptor-like n=1 Tax=Penaeus japonicus TaxID=27405 RepID=UPI001C715EC4|nr:cation-dependent mannose-6-phosphate receptor-like [Penaeus japonicus]
MDLISPTAVFFVISVLLGFGAALMVNDSCKQMSTCRCQFEDGLEINLMKVAADPLDAPRFKELTATNKSDKSLYSYNPCYSYVFPPDGQEMSCGKDVAVCQSSILGTINIGKQSRAKFHFDNSTDHWILSYYNDNGDRLSNVILQCTDGDDDVLEVFGETKGQHRSVYNMTLKSKCACIGGCLTPILPHGMSVGSLFLLLLLIFICVYLTVGYLYRRFVIGARGIELLPHLSFWMDFPYLVQDGLFFLLYCGRRDVTYERI